PNGARCVGLAREVVDVGDGDDVAMVEVRGAVVEDFEVRYVDRVDVGVSCGDGGGRGVVGQIVERLGPGVVGQQSESVVHALLAGELQRVEGAVCAGVGLGDGSGVAVVGCGGA